MAGHGTLDQSYTPAGLVKRAARRSLAHAYARPFGSVIHVTHCYAVDDTTNDNLLKKRKHLAICYDIVA